MRARTGRRWRCRPQDVGLAALVWALVAATPAAAQQEQAAARPRARELSIAPGVFAPGPINAITDVEGVAVGHLTLIEGETIRTGVTVVLPHEGDVFFAKVPGAVFIGNAFGKLAGSTQVEELGTIESPIVLTNTLAVGAAVEGVIRWTLARPGHEGVRSVNALVGETNDGRLNDIRALRVRPEHVIQAIDGARRGPVAEGNVGAGTGTTAFGWKAGIGTSSRRVPVGEVAYVVGVLVQANFGGVLSVDGVPVGKLWGRHPYAGGQLPSTAPAVPGERDGSCMIVVATDAPLDARDLRRLAARAVFGLARTGSSFSNGSGDYAVAFSTDRTLRVTHGRAGPEGRRVLPTEALSPLFQGVLEATEEAVYNALLQATTMTGNGVTVEAIPIEQLQTLLQRYR